MDLSSFISGFGGVSWAIAAFIVAISIIVAVHEYGHYIVGRWCGIHADVFSIGFGPVIWSRNDRRGTRWQIAALPFGGYVKFAGDADAASGMDAQQMAEAAADPVAFRRTMHGAPLWARSATVAAGPVFNFIMSILLFAVLLMVNGQSREILTVGTLYPLPVENTQLAPGDAIKSIGGVDIPPQSDPNFATRLASIPQMPLLDYRVERGDEIIEISGPYPRPPRVGFVVPRSAAHDIGIEPGDVIMSVNDSPIFAFDQILSAVEGSQGHPLVLQIWRDGALMEFALAPRSVDEPQPGGGFAKAWRIGIVASLAFEPATESVAIGAAIMSGARQVGRIITNTLDFFVHLVRGAVSSCNLNGPIGIAEISGSMASQGADSFWRFIAVLSTAIGLLNLFPIPTLDGGHLVFYAYEAIRGKAPAPRAAEILMTIGITLVISFMIFALINDIFCP